MLETILRDGDGIPIPQIFDQDKNQFIPALGKNGAMYIKDIDRPTNGIIQVQLMGVNGPIAGTTSGLSVALNNTFMNMMSYDGVTWREACDAKCIPLLPSAQYASALTYSQDIWNPGKKNLLLILNITAGAGSITGVTLQIKVGSIYVPYKTITQTPVASTGSYILLIGADAELPANKIILPAQFRIVVNSTNANAVTYSLDAQLV